jgi:hypothetical protein
MITVIGVTYDHMPYKLPAFIYSLLSQTYKDWKAIILHDGPDLSHKNRMFLNSLKDPRISYIETDKRENCWGHNLRKLGLSLVETKYLNFQNCDNQLFPPFLEGLLSVCERSESDVAICNFVHSHQEYGAFFSTFSISQCDIANFIIKTEIAKEIGFNHVEFAADGKFIEEVKSARSNLKVVKHQSVLMVHN